MCGKAKLTTREAKICADHFLTLLDAAQHNVTDLPPNGQLRGLPDLNVYSQCFKAKSYYQVWMPHPPLTPGGSQILGRCIHIMKEIQNSMAALDKSCVYPARLSV